MPMSREGREWGGKGISEETSSQSRPAPRESGGVNGAPVADTSLPFTSRGLLHQAHCLAGPAGGTGSDIMSCRHRVSGKPGIGPDEMCRRGDTQ